MNDKQRVYIAIDLKSFYASVECVERGLNPLTTCLTVADQSRTEKTICLAVSPSLKAFGVSSRPRLFEVVQQVKKVNRKREAKAGHPLFDKSYHYPDLIKNDQLLLDYIVAVPRMALYIDYSARIYNIYLKYVDAKDIHVYSIDEVFMDITNYLHLYESAEELTRQIIHDVLFTTGITATAGIGTNLYLAKVAMDIVAKKKKADRYGVRIAYLDEYLYRKLLWDHQPLTDFWRVGAGYQRKLHSLEIFTMGDIARVSMASINDRINEDTLYQLFGINAELLIDHAWGVEPVTMEDIHNYRPVGKSLGVGQVLHCPYTFNQARIAISEMTDALVLDMVNKHLVCDVFVITVGYDIDNVNDQFKGRISEDVYGRKMPYHAHGTTHVMACSSTRIITDAVLKLYDEIVDKSLLIRRLNVCAAHIMDESILSKKPKHVQLSLFDAQIETVKQEVNQYLDKEKKIQRAILEIHQKFGKNALLKGTNFMDGATAQERNEQIGGHKA